MIELSVVFQIAVICACLVYVADQLEHRVRSFAYKNKRRRAEMHDRRVRKLLADAEPAIELWWADKGRGQVLASMPSMPEDIAEQMPEEAKNFLTDRFLNMVKERVMLYATHMLDDQMDEEHMRTHREELMMVGINIDELEKIFGK